MSSISVYAFETEGDEVATEWTTQSFEEAREFAQMNGYSIIEREYEYSDSSLIEDYRPGHALDGTPLTLCPQCGALGWVLPCSECGFNGGQIELDTV